jgi:hypothetical protein
VLRVALAEETFGVDEAEVVVGLGKALLLGLGQKGDDGLVHLVVH